MTLHQLRIFMAVAQSSTLTRASKQLGLAQPSLSQQLAKLEESVGTRLFERSHNRMVLTDAGQVLVRHAQDVLKKIDEAEASLRQFSSGKRFIIRIAGLNSVVKAVLPDALNKVTGKDVRVDVKVDPSIIGGLIVKLGSRMVTVRSALSSMPSSRR